MCSDQCSIRSESDICSHSGHFIEVSCSFLYIATDAIVYDNIISILRNQPILPWDSDADIYLVLEDDVEEIESSRDKEMNDIMEQDMDNEYANYYAMVMMGRYSWIDW